MIFLWPFFDVKDVYANSFFPPTARLEFSAYIDKNWYHVISFIKQYLEQFSKFPFQKVADPVGQLNRHILEVLLTHRHILVAQNRWTSLGYTTGFLFKEFLNHYMCFNLIYLKF